MVTEFRDGIAARGLSYAAGISREITTWPGRLAPLSPRRWTGVGCPAELLGVSRYTVYRMLNRYGMSEDRAYRTWRKSEAGGPA